MPTGMIHPDDLNEACERFLVNFLRTQLDELEWLGAGDIVYAERARAYIRRYDAALDASEARPLPQAGRHLRSVG
jgi:hypothetical protein